MADGGCNQISQYQIKPQSKTDTRQCKVKRVDSIVTDATGNERLTSGLPDDQVLSAVASKPARRNCAVDGALR